MKFFLEDITSTKVDEILARLNKLKDGDVADQMKSKGLNYKLNYGASILWLRSLAKSYAGDNNLAERLWYRQIRETMILSTLVVEVDKLTSEKLEEWTELLHHNEIAEQLGANLLWKISDLKSLSQKWLDGVNCYKQATIWVALSVYLQKGNELSGQQIDYYFRTIERSINDAGSFMLRVQGRFLRQLCRSKYLNNVELFLNKVKLKTNCNWLVEDVQTEIDFVKGK